MPYDTLRFVQTDGSSHGTTGARQRLSHSSLARLARTRGLQQPPWSVGADVARLWLEWASAEAESSL